MSTTRWPAPTIPAPSTDDLIDEYFEEGLEETSDGCYVEPDGTCEHGHPSWLLRLGLI